MKSKKPSEVFEDHTQPGEREAVRFEVRSGDVILKCRGAIESAKLKDTTGEYPS